MLNKQKTTMLDYWPSQQYSQDWKDGGKALGSGLHLL